MLALLLCVLPGAARGQAFIASLPDPDFRIGPLFVSASVKPVDVEAPKGPQAPQAAALTVVVSWSLVLPPQRKAADVAQDLYLMWPGEVVGTPGATGADPDLVHRLGEAGFSVKESGRLRLLARSRTDMGTGTSTGFVTLGEAPFATFVREGGPAGARGAALIRIPWKPEMASLDWLVRLEIPLREVILATRVSWIEETFWGRRYVLTLGFGDVGYPSLYPLYFGARDRVVPLSRDFSMLQVNFSNAAHLKVEELIPATATRSLSETRADTETFRLPLVASEGLAPQQLKIRFAYFSGRLPWRPILISALLLGLGNLTGPLFLALGRRLARTFRTRIHVGRSAEAEPLLREALSMSAIQAAAAPASGRMRPVAKCRRRPKSTSGCRPARRGRSSTGGSGWCPTAAAPLAGSPRSATGMWKTTRSRSISSGTACATSRRVSADPSWGPGLEFTRS